MSARDCLSLHSCGAAAWHAYCHHAHACPPQAAPCHLAPHAGVLPKRLEAGASLVRRPLLQQVHAVQVVISAAADDKGADSHR